LSELFFMEIRNIPVMDFMVAMELGKFQPG
jgi:hypothetical protein